MPANAIDRSDRLLTIREIGERVRTSCSKILRREKVGEFPRRNLSVKRLARWPESAMTTTPPGAGSRRSTPPSAARKPPTDVMADAAKSSAAGGELLPPPHAHPYVHALRLRQTAREFVELCKKPSTDGRALDTRCYEGPELFTCLLAPGAGRRWRVLHLREHIQTSPAHGCQSARLAGVLHRPRFSGSSGLGRRH